MRAINSSGIAKDKNERLENMEKENEKIFIANWTIYHTLRVILMKNFNARENFRCKNKKILKKVLN